MRSPSTLRLAALLAVLAVGPGCHTIGGRSVEPGTVTYVMGAFETRIEASVEDVHAAVEEVLEDMSLRVESSAVTHLDARVVAHTAQDKRLAIDLMGLRDGTTVISIRGGTLGDKKLSRQVYERVLGAL